MPAGHIARRSCAIGLSPQRNAASALASAKPHDL